MVNFFVIPYTKPPKQKEDTTTLKLSELSELSEAEAIQPIRGEDSLTEITTNESNVDLLPEAEAIQPVQRGEDSLTEITTNESNGDLLSEAEAIQPIREEDSLTEITTNESNGDLLSEAEAIQPIQRGNYSLTQIATNESNGDLLYVVEGDIDTFLLDYPEAIAYYEADWFQNYYPDAPGINPIEKYYNAISSMAKPNPPIWSKIISDFARDRGLFSKLLTTTNPNAFSALQTAIQYRNMDLFKELALTVIAGIPGGLSEKESDTLNEILEDNNFPNLEEMLNN